MKETRLRKNPFLRIDDRQSSGVDLLLGRTARLEAGDRRILEAGEIEATDPLGTLSTWSRFFAALRVRRLFHLGFLQTEAEQERLRTLPLSTIDLELTAHCQADCPICPRDEMPRAKVHMMDEAIDRLLEQLPRYRSVVFLSGLGDCLLHPKFVEHYTRLREAAGSVRVVTNGALLHGDRAEVLLRLPPSHLSISFQAFSKSTYEQTMHLPFEETRQRIREFLRAAGGRIPITLCLVRTRQNEHEVKAFEREWREYKAATHVSDVHHRGGWMSDPAVAAPLPAKNQSLRRCGLFNTRIFIAATGDILPCCHDMTASDPLGHLLTNSFEDILRKKLDRIHKENLYAMCNACDDATRFLTISPR